MDVTTNGRTDVRDRTDTTDATDATDATDRRDETDEKANGGLERFASVPWKIGS